MKYIIAQQDFYDLKIKLQLWMRNIYQKKYYHKIKNWINKYLALCENFYYQSNSTLKSLIKKYFKDSKRTFYLWAKKIINCYNQANFWDLCYKSTRPKTIHYQFSSTIKKQVCDYYYTYKMIGAGGVLSLFHNFHQGKVDHFVSEQIPKSILTFYRWIRSDSRFAEIQNKKKKLKRYFKRYEVQEVGLLQMDAKVLTNLNFPIKNKCFFVYDFIDEKTRIVFGYVYQKLGLENAVDAVENAIKDFQKLGIIVKRIRTDNGVEFNSSLRKKTKDFTSISQNNFSQFLSSKNIKHELTAICSPQSNGKIEAFHKNYQKIFCFENFSTIKLEQMQLQNYLNDWYLFYNFKRCHKALKLRTPFEELTKN